MAGPFPGVKISALTAGTALAGTEYFPAVQGGATVKVTLAGAAIDSPILTTPEVVGKLWSDSDGVGALPSSTTTAGWAITSNYTGFGEVNFWSTVNSADSSQGFAWNQKLTEGTYIYLSTLFGDATFTEWDLYLNGSIAMYQYVDATGIYFYGAGLPFIFNQNSSDALTISAAGIVDAVVQLKGKGTATNDAAAAGYIGEVASSIVLVGSAVGLTTNTAANVTSLSLTAGDWEVSGEVWFSQNAATVATIAQAAITTTSATLPTVPAVGTALSKHSGTEATGSGAIVTVGPCRMTLAATTTVYLVAQSTFTVNTNAAYGKLRARRAR